MILEVIKLKDLNESYIQDLKSRHDDLEQPISIWINEVSRAMPEDEFWYIISLLDWSKTTNEEIVSPAITYLSELSIEKIEAFEDILSQKLYQLDGEKYAMHTGENAYKNASAPFSVDVFLYARCAVIAKGKVIFEQVLVQPENMVKNETFEPLLSLAVRAYRIKTNTEFEYMPAFIYETFANAENWQNEGLLNKLIHS